MRSVQSRSVLRQIGKLRPPRCQGSAFGVQSGARMFTPPPNLRETPLMQWRNPVGLGPSSKTWP